MGKGKKKKKKKKDGHPDDHDVVHFLYSEAVAKVLYQYGSCIDLVSPQYPPSYLFKDNSGVCLDHLPRLHESYPVPAPKLPPPPSERSHSSIVTPHLSTVRSVGTNSRLSESQFSKMSYIWEEDDDSFDLSTSQTIILPDIHKHILPRTSTRVNLNESKGGHHHRTAGKGQSTAQETQGQNQGRFLPIDLTVREKRSAYLPRLLPSALGKAPTPNFSNRAIIEKLYLERIPLYEMD